MCFIISVKQLDPTRTEPRIERHIKALIENQFLVHKDGAFLHRGNSHNNELKTLDYKQAQDWITSQSNLDSLLIHLRQATAGGISHQNIHGYRHNNWTFLHNGGLFGDWDYKSQSSYYGYSNFASNKTGKSDSLKFFSKLCKQLGSRTHIEDIADIINKSIKTGFWGRGLLHNSKTDDLFIFGKDWQIYIINELYFVLASTPLDFDEIITFTDYHGLVFDRTQLTNFDVQSTELTGIAVITKFHTHDFKYEWLADLLSETEAKSKPVITTITADEPVNNALSLLEQEMIDKELETARELEVDKSLNEAIK